MIESLGLESITPLHPARQLGYVKNLAIDMKENGWKGRPLLVIERKDDYLAWTGSHRLVAAELAGLKSVPCYVLQETELTAKGFDAERGHVEDHERLEILKQIGNEEAFKLMWMENRAP